MSAKVVYSNVTVPLPYKTLFSSDALSVGRTVFNPTNSGGETGESSDAKVVQDANNDVARIISTRPIQKKSRNNLENVITTIRDAISYTRS
jgi:hypothetical protein